MTTLHLTITLNEDRAQRLVELAQSLNTSTDLMVQAIVDANMELREIDDKTMTDSAIFSMIANSPFGKTLLPSPTCQGRSKTVPLRRSKTGPPGWCLTVPTARGGVGPPALATVRHWHPRGANRRLTAPTRARQRGPAGCP